MVAPAGFEPLPYRKLRKLGQPASTNRPALTVQCAQFLEFLQVLVTHPSPICNSKMSGPPLAGKVCASPLEGRAWSPQDACKCNALA